MDETTSNPQKLWTVYKGTLQEVIDEIDDRRPEKIGGFFEHSDGDYVALVNNT